MSRADGDCDAEYAELGAFLRLAATKLADQASPFVGGVLLFTALTGRRRTEPPAI